MFLIFCLVALVFFIAGCYVGGTKVGNELRLDILALEQRVEKLKAGAQGKTPATPPATPATQA